MQFHVENIKFELNFSTMKWVKMQNFGDQALFFDFPQSAGIFSISQLTQVAHLLITYTKLDLSLAYTHHISWTLEIPSLN